MCSMERTKNMSDISDDLLLNLKAEIDAAYKRGRADERKIFPQNVCGRPTVEQVRWMFDRLFDHMLLGGSFRYLIYNRMGLTRKDYETLLNAGGLLISNALNEARDRKVKSLKPKTSK